MALPTTPTGTWNRALDLPSRLLGEGGFGGDDYELYEADDEFVLSVDMPGVAADDIDVAWDDGVLNVAAERADDRPGRRRTYHRRFRFPTAVDDDAITAEYTNGVLEVRLPLARDAAARGKPIPVEG